MKLVFKLLLSIATLISASAFSQDNGIEVKVGREHATEHQLHILKSFPEAAPGEKRVVIFVPHRHGSQGQDLKLEVRVGMSMTVDACGSYVLGNLAIDSIPWAGTPYSELVAKPSPPTASVGPESADVGGEGRQSSCVHGQVQKMVYSKVLWVAADAVMPIVIYTLPELKVEYRGLPGQLDFQSTEP